MNLYGYLDYDIFLITTQKIKLNEEVTKRITTKIDYVYFDDFLPKDYNMTIDEFINNEKNNNKQYRVYDINNHILTKYKKVKRIELFPKLIKYIANHIDENTSIPILKKHLLKYDKKVIPLNIQTFIYILEDNFIVNRVNYIDMNTYQPQITYFKYYFSNLSKLFLFNNQKINDYKIYKNLIYQKLLYSNIEVYTGKYIRYSKKDGLTIKIRF